MWSALTPALKFRGVWITAPALTPALHLLLQKRNFVKKELRKKFFTTFLLISGQKNCMVNCVGVDFFEF